MSNLMHLIYASKSTIEFSEETIIGLLKKARANNKLHNVTGMLLFDNGSFLQVIEGEEKTINNLFYEKIKKDTRHTNIVLIISEAIAERQFKDWTMGFATLSKNKITQMDGMNDFFLENTCLTNIDQGRAKKILNAFANGRWRLE